MKQRLWIYYFLIFFLISCGTRKPDSSFTFERTDQGVGLSENGKPVFFYQEKQKSLDGKYICNNYLHPLYSLNGDTLTEEFPVDHPYPTGVFTGPGTKFTLMAKVWVMAGSWKILHRMLPMSLQPPKTAPPN